MLSPILLSFHEDNRRIIRVLEDPFRFINPNHILALPNDFLDATANFVLVVLREHSYVALAAHAILDARFRRMKSKLILAFKNDRLLEQCRIGGRREYAAPKAKTELR